MTSTRSAFFEYLISENKAGSNKASSYIRALDLLEGMLKDEPLGFEDCRDLWNVASVDRLQKLLLQVREEQSRGDKSRWFLPQQRSYLEKGFIKAALGLYRHFLAAYQHEAALVDVFRGHKGDPEELATLLNREPELPDFLTVEFEGKEAVRQIKVRLNQKVYRRIILENYNYRCCVTGLDLPELCIASHIIPWADREDTRMDPRNGLCLSGTFDRAFDQHLITFDEDYRLVVSKNIRDHYHNDQVRELFAKREGARIWLPIEVKRRPLQVFLGEHRNLLV